MPFRSLFFRVVLVTLPVLAASGCDLLGPAGELHAGVVVERGTGVPIPGIHVSFQQVGNVGNTTIINETQTDENGHFQLRRTRGALFVNDPPCYGSEPCLHNPAYSGGAFTIGNTDPAQIRIELIGPGTPPGAP